MKPYPPRYLPPELGGSYTTNVNATTTVTALTLDRGSHNGVQILCRADQALLVHVYQGADLGAGDVWHHKRTYSVPAGDGDGEGQQIPVECCGSRIRIDVENPGGDATTSLSLVAYLVTVGAIPHLTKPTKVLWSGQTLTAGAADTFSDPVDLSNTLGAQVWLQVTNGATGPTVPPRVQVQTSCDGVNWGDYQEVLPVAASGSSGVFPTTNNAVSRWAGAIPHTARYMRLRAGSNTGQNVTISAQVNLAHY